MSSDSSALDPLLLHAFSNQRFFLGAADEAKDHEQLPPSCWRLLITFWSNFLIQLVRFVELRLALHNSLISLVELTDNCTLRYSGHALYHSRSPYVPMLTTLTLYHVIRDGLAWTLGGLLVALVVGNLCINVYYKTVRGSFHMLGLPLPAPAFHCDVLPEQRNLSPTPSPPPPLLTSLGVTTSSPFFGSEAMTNHRHHHQNHQHRHDLFSFSRVFDRGEDYVLTSTSSSSSDSSYDDGDDDDSNTASTVSTVADNAQTVFGRVLNEIREKVEVCQDQDTIVDDSVEDRL